MEEAKLDGSNDRNVITRSLLNKANWLCYLYSVCPCNDKLIFWIVTATIYGDFDYIINKRHGFLHLSRYELRWKFWWTLCFETHLIPRKREIYESLVFPLIWSLWFESRIFDYMVCFDFVCIHGKVASKMLHCGNVMSIIKFILHAVPNFFNQLLQK